MTSKVVPTLKLDDSGDRICGAQWGAHIPYWCPGLSLGYTTYVLASASAPGRQQVMAQVLGPLPVTWETKREFWAPCFDVAQSWPLWAFGEWTRG